MEIDDDCNGLIDEDIPFYTFYLDNDEDGYGFIDIDIYRQ
jgi:hypothetical protein